MTNKRGNVINKNINNGEIISDLSRATSGTIVNNFRTGYKVQVVWNVNSQNVVNNTSNVTVQVQLVSTGSAYTISSTATKNGSLAINGTTYNFTFGAKLRGSETKTVFTKTVDIPHNADGSKTCAMSATLGINITLSGTYWGNVSASGNAALNSIPRTSSFSLNTTTGTIGSTQFTVNINRTSSAFTHKVYYRFGNINWLGSSNATTSFSFTPSLDDCSQIPNATSGVGTIIVETWNGGTHIGTTSQNITLHVPESVKPSFSSLGAQLIEAGASSSFGYVKGKSKCKLSVNGATGSHGSNIVSYHISGGGFSSNQWQFTTEALTQAGNITFSAYIIDTRGRRSDTKTVTINVKDYTSPIIDIAAAYRCNSQGVPNDNGTYIKILLEDITSNIAGNAYSNKIEYKQSSSSAWINVGTYASAKGMVIGNGAISTSSTYNVRFTVSDSFETVTKILDVAPAFVTIDFRKGGKGIAIGKASEKDNLFEVAMETKLSGNSNCVTGQNNTASTKVSNLNDIWKSGFYDCEGASNMPFGGWNWVIHAGHTNNKTDYKYGMQIAGQNGTNNFAMRNVNASGAGQWNTLYHTGNKPTWNDIQSKPSVFDCANDNWFYRSGKYNYLFHHATKNNGSLVIAPSSAVGGWDANWTNEFNFNPDGTFDAICVKGRDYIEGWTTYTRTISNYNGNNLDISTRGKALALNCGSASGIYVDFRPQWSGSKGTEPSFFNTSGVGWGYIGGSGYSWYRIYGAGGSVSDRNKKYNITKADCSEQYENVKCLNLYNYRTISDKVNEETNEVEEEIFRQDLMLGTMVDELPTETVFYDNESGDGKAVDMYSYTSMILGATKHLIEKVETLEKENELKDKKIEDLEQRLEKMEEMLNGIINKG